MYYTKIANFDFKLNLLKGPSIDFFLSHDFEITYVPRFQNALVCSWAFNLGLFTTTGGTVPIVLQKCYAPKSTSTINFKLNETQPVGLLQ